MSHKYIETFTGKRFYPLDPTPFDVCIEDIAHALSRQCRFAGHVKDFYSVAEHSIWTAYVLEVTGHDSRTQLWGLMHDASEAYLVDLPTPLKTGVFGEAYRKAEANLMKVIADKFGLGECPEAVYEYDAAMLSSEARQFMFYNPDNWRNLADPVGFPLPRLGDIAFVEKTFIRQFDYLVTQL